MTLTVARLRGASIGFRLTFGRWPQRIYVAPGVLAEHARTVATSGYGWTMDAGELMAVLARVQVLPSLQFSDYVAEDEFGNRFDYGSECGDSHRQSDRGKGLYNVWLASAPQVWGAPSGVALARPLPLKDAAAVSSASTEGVADDAITGLIPLVRPSGELARLFETPLQQIGFALRTLNCLRNAKWMSLGDVVQRTPDELLALRNFGVTSLRDVALRLHALGLGFSMRFLGGAERGDVVILDPGAAPLDVVSVSESELAAAEARLTAGDADTTVVESLDFDHVGKATGLLSGSLERLPGGQTVIPLLVEKTRDAGRGSGMPVKAIPAYVAALIDGYAAMAAGESFPPSREIAAAVQHLKPNDVRAATMYLGLSGEPELTLEATGGQLGVTRERARQLTARFRTGVESIRPVLPVCQATLAILDASDRPLTLEEWRLLLPPSIRPPNARELAAFRHLESWGWIPRHSWIEHGATWLVGAAGSDADIATLTEKYENGTRPYRAWGAVQVDRLATEVGAPVPAIAAMLAADSRWTSAGSQWWIREKPQQSVLSSRAIRLLSLLGTLGLDDVRLGLRRAARRPARTQSTARHIPPRTVLARVLERLGCELDDAKQVVRLGKTAPRQSPSPTDIAILGAFAAGSTAVTLDELISAMHAHGLSTASAMMATTYSPLLRRVESCVYALLGRPVIEAQLADARKRVYAISEAARISHEVYADGRVAVDYLTDRVTRTVATLPPGVVAPGDWMLHTPTWQAGVTVRSGYVTGVSRYARTLSRAGIARFRLVFREADRVVELEPLAQATEALSA